MLQMVIKKDDIRYPQRHIIMPARFCLKLQTLQSLQLGLQVLDLELVQFRIPRDLDLLGDSV